MDDIVDDVVCRLQIAALVVRYRTDSDHTLAVAQPD